MQNPSLRFETEATDFNFVQSGNKCSEFNLINVEQSKVIG